MATGLEDELCDILQKAREGRRVSLIQLAKNSGIFLEDIHRAENEGFIPSDETIQKLANALELHGPSLVDIAKGVWVPDQPEPSADFEVFCIEAFMGKYPVKCYLLKCNETGAVAVIDTGGNPEVVIKKTRELGVTPSMILLTHSHSDHEGGVHILDTAFNCPVWSDKMEHLSVGCRKQQFAADGDIIELGKLKIKCLSTPGHTIGGISYYVSKAVFSGDVIFAGSMGRANSSFTKLFQAVIEKILVLPDDTAIYPGHGPTTTVGQEKLHNPFFCGKVVTADASPLQK